MKDQADEIREITLRILQYLEQHPRAGDSLDGIVEWWLWETANESGKAKTNAAIAINNLVEEGKLMSTTLADGTVIYKLNVTHK